MLGGADNPNGELPSYITGADTIARTQAEETISPLNDALPIFPVTGGWLKENAGYVHPHNSANTKYLGRHI
ncbi:TPA: hypothetical protein OZR88_004770 [Escherichia coli]|nr:hypothetical protein [Escherichia coli]